MATLNVHRVFFELKFKENHLDSMQYKKLKILFV